MICRRRTEPPAKPAGPPQTPPASLGHAEPSEAYDGAFWLACLSNLTVMLAIVLLYRYADLVAYLGGTEFHLGWIVGLGMVGALVVRPGLGRMVDRYGAHRIWWASLLALAACCFGHLAVRSYNGPTIYVLRLGYSAAVAGLFGGSITWICRRVPPARAAEMIGVLGSSGFLAMIIGGPLSDLLLGTRQVEWVAIRRMFLAAGGLALAALALAYLAARGSAPPVPRRRAPLWGLVWRYSPRMLILMGMAIGAALALPSTFMRPFALELGGRGFALFFTVYAATAILARVGMRRLPERLGFERTILLGAGLIVPGLLLFAWVRAPWQLAVPAVVFGVGHAFVLPSMIAAGSQAFPLRHRGTGTMLASAFTDAGALVGAPLAGMVLRASPGWGLPAYPTMFVTVAALVGVAGLVYARWILARGLITTAAAAVRRRRRVGLPTMRPHTRPPVAAVRGPAVSFRTDSAGPAPCTLESDPCVMRVQEPLEGVGRTFDDTTAEAS